MPKRKLDPSLTQECSTKKSCTLSDAPKPGNGKRVRFAGLTAYYFPRAQGFCCVPSTGGTALGMGDQHEEVRQLSLTEHEEELRGKRERILAEMAAQGMHEEEEEEEEDDEVVSDDGDETESCDETIEVAEAVHTNGHSEYSYHSHTNGHHQESVPPELSHAAEVPHHHQQEGEAEAEDLDQYYLMPLAARRRVALLRESGVEALSIRSEKELCQEIRESRQLCGCSCPGGRCDEATCDCAKAGIRCQVDRASFPCACTRQTCGNPAGRLEFDPIRVKSHFLNTMLRLRLSDKGREMPPSTHLRFSLDEEEAPLRLDALYAHHPTASTLPTT